MWDKDSGDTCELIKDRLYFTSLPCKPRNTANTHYFTTDDDWSFYSRFMDTPYFGPSNLSAIYRFCCLLNTKLNMQAKKKKIVHYTTVQDGINGGKKRTKAAFLIGAYAICQLNMTPEDVFSKLKEAMDKTFAPFSDVNGSYSNHNLNLLDCLKGFHKGISKGFFHFEEFDLNAYEHDEKMFDLNWIVPNKIAAMMDPQKHPALRTNKFSKLRRYFKETKVKSVVRLNRDDIVMRHGFVYDSKCFTEYGFSHHDLSFEDGGIPSKTKIKKFLKIVDHTDGAVVVHCRAGLGRTGTMICTYLVKQYGFTTAEAVAWLRICRPGSVMSFQQQYLHSREFAMYLQRLDNRNEGGKDVREIIRNGIISQHKSFELIQRGRDISDKENQGSENEPAVADSSRKLEHIEEEEHQALVVRN